ncbi:hypothetical protein U1Q18_050900 [Sarracenia purpurea var. burkii]
MTGDNSTHTPSIRAAGLFSQCHTTGDCPKQTTRTLRFNYVREQNETKKSFRLPALSPALHRVLSKNFTSLIFTTLKIVLVPNSSDMYTRIKRE